MEQYIAAEKQLTAELEQILQGEGEMNVKAKKAAKLIRNTLSSFRNQIREQGFRSDDDEIYFFKNIKPKIHAFSSATTALHGPRGWVRGCCDGSHARRFSLSPRALGPGSGMGQYQPRSPRVEYQIKSAIRRLIEPDLRIAFASA